MKKLTMLIFVSLVVLACCKREEPTSYQWAIQERGHETIALQVLFEKVPTQERWDEVKKIFWPIPARGFDCAVIFYREEGPRSFFLLAEGSDCSQFDPFSWPW